MKELFNPNNPLMRFLTFIFYCIYLNILFIITSIPIITIGASITALCGCTHKIINKEETYIHRDYFYLFKKNFIESTKIWIPLLCIIAILSGNLYIVFNILPKNYFYFQIPIWILLFLCFSIYLYGFPLVANFSNTFKGTIKNAVLISIAHLPTTIMLLVFHALPIFYIAFSWENLIIAFSLFLFMGFGFYSFLCNFFITNIFKKINEND